MRSPTPPRRARVGGVLAHDRSIEPQSVQGGGRGTPVRQGSKSWETWNKPCSCMSACSQGARQTAPCPPLERACSPACASALLPRQTALRSLGKLGAGVCAALHSTAPPPPWEADRRGHRSQTQRGPIRLGRQQPFSARGAISARAGKGGEERARKRRSGCKGRPGALKGVFHILSYSVNHASSLLCSTRTSLASTGHLVHPTGAGPFTSQHTNAMAAAAALPRIGWIGTGIMGR